MKISTKGRYALRVLADLAEHQGEGLISLKEIAQRQQISKKYLEQIVPLLNRAGLLYTGRGYQGGYRLSKAPAEYTVKEILEVTEGSLCSVSCLEQKPNRCSRCKECVTLPVWEGLDQAIGAYLEGITLQDILDRQSGKNPTYDSI